MITNVAWIGAVDHRISAAIVFFVLLLLLNTGARRRLFPLRAGAVLLTMCAVSWVLRSLSDVWLADARLQALCFSAQVMALHMLFLAGSWMRTMTERASKSAEAVSCTLMQKSF